jgi:hypothetical protein
VQAWRAHPLNAGRKGRPFLQRSVFLIVQSTPKLSLLDCCNHANRRLYACETLVNTQVPVSPRALTSTQGAESTYLITTTVLMHINRRFWKSPTKHHQKPSIFVDATTFDIVKQSPLRKHQIYLKLIEPHIWFFRFLCSMVDRKLSSLDASRSEEIIKFQEFGREILYIWKISQLGIFERMYFLTWRL